MGYGWGILYGVWGMVSTALAVRTLGMGYYYGVWPCCGGAGSPGYGV